MNNVSLIGRLTRDPELRFAPNTGKPVCKFTLAVRRPLKKDEADFINCVAFGKTAETIAQHITKGREIGVNGSIRTGSYDAQDGSKRYTTDVWVSSLTFISGGQANNNTNSNYNNGFDGSFDDDITPCNDEDMPF